MTADIVQTIRAITLDVGHTLLFPDPSLGRVYARVAAEHGLDVDDAWAEEAFGRAWRAVQAEQEGLIYGRTHADALAFWRQVIGRMFAARPLAPGALAALTADLYEAFSHASAWRVNADFFPLLEACAAREIRLGLISNWDQRLRGLLEELGIVDDVDPVVISAECGVEKPSAAIFRIAIDAWSLPAEAILHIGDTWAEDVEGARAAGLRPVWFNPAGLPCPNGDVLEIETLKEIADALRSV